MHAIGLDGDGRPLPHHLRPACGAKNRKGQPCAARAIPGKRRCRFHGGLSTGPKTADGRARIAAAQRRRWARQRGDDTPAAPTPITATEVGWELGALPLVRMGPDEICRLAEQAPEVREAAVRWDRATPSTHRDLVAARLVAQTRLGIPEAKRAPLYAAEVEAFLIPVMVRMDHGDEEAVVIEMRRELTRLYGEYGEAVLMFMLRTYRHHSTEALLRAATATRP
jgi:hypothetical protein